MILKHPCTRYKGYFLREKCVRPCGTECIASILHAAAFVYNTLKKKKKQHDVSESICNFNIKNIKIRVDGPLGLQQFERHRIEFPKRTQRYTLRGHRYSFDDRISEWVIITTFVCNIWRIILLGLFIGISEVAFLLNVDVNFWRIIIQFEIGGWLCSTKLFA